MHAIARACGSLLASLGRLRGLRWGWQHGRAHLLHRAHILGGHLACHGARSLGARAHASQPIGTLIGTALAGLWRVVASWCFALILLGDAVNQLLAVGRHATIGKKELGFLASHTLARVHHWRYGVVRGVNQCLHTGWAAQGLHRIRR